MLLLFFMFFFMKLNKNLNFFVLSFPLLQNSLDILTILLILVDSLSWGREG